LSAWAMLPQSGLGVRVYSSSEAVARQQWQKSYSSVVTRAYTDVAQAPYLNYREFPLEWINSPGFTSSDFWANVQFGGNVRLGDNERLVFLVQGAKNATLNYVDEKSQRAVPAPWISSFDELSGLTYQKLPDLKDFTIQGSLLLTKLGQSRLEPLLVSPSGAYGSALPSARIWTDPAGAGIAIERVEALLVLVDVLGLGLIGIISAAFLRGILTLYRNEQLTALDLYLGASGLLGLYLTSLVARPEVNLVLIPLIGLFGGLKIMEAVISPRRRSVKGLLFSVGVVLLLVFAVMELGSLRALTIFPPFQDGLEYQNFARNIVVKGDVLLLQSPPRAYKVLFPYLVGLLHAVFGQSASAQLFLNAWAAILTGMLIAGLMKASTPAPISFTAATVWMILLCLPSTYVYYFRFGLIEPIAILLLVACCFFAAQGRPWEMLTAGLLTVLFRLDYLGGVLAAAVLTTAPITGSAPVAWRILRDRVRARWKPLLVYGAWICLPPLLIILGYLTFTPAYVLNATDTRHSSLASVAAGLLRVVAGGDSHELRVRWLGDPAGSLLLSAVLILGFLLAGAAIVIRAGVLEKVDLRLAVLAPSILPAYLAVQPTGYAPRFSLPLLPFDLMLLGVLVHRLIPRLDSRSGHE